jgi:hypothetical protein
MVVLLCDKRYVGDCSARPSILYWRGKKFDEEEQLWFLGFAAPSLVKVKTPPHFLECCIEEFITRLRGGLSLPHQ